MDLLGPGPSCRCRRTCGEERAVTWRAPGEPPTRDRRGPDRAHDLPPRSPEEPSDSLGGQGRLSPQHPGEIGRPDEKAAHGGKRLAVGGRPAPSPGESDAIGGQGGDGHGPPARTPGGAGGRPRRSEPTSPSQANASSVSSVQVMRTSCVLADGLRDGILQPRESRRNPGVGLFRFRGWIPRAGASGMKGGTRVR